MARPALVLLHSPLVGPATMEPLAEALRRRGRTVVVPRMHEAGFSATPRWMSWVAAATEQIKDVGAGSVVLVGHSGAGLLLPVVAERLEPHIAGVVFVDAGLPPSAGDVVVADGDFLAHLRVIAVDGVLPPWSEWWGPEVMSALIPDAGQRAAVEVEQPRLPLAFFEATIPVPPGWDVRHPVGYVRLSAAYDREADLARERGFPVSLFEGAHLDTVTRPDELGQIVQGMVASLLNATP